MKILFFLLAIYSTSIFALDALVIGVHDGDSITIANTLKKVRIRNMDAPELANKSLKWGYQPYANEAHDSLLKLCQGKIATLSNIKPDIYKTRMDADVSCQGYDVAQWQIDNGFAWGYHYAPKKYKRMALTAKNKALGLWAQPAPIDPWAWRKNKLH